MSYVQMHEVVPEPRRHRAIIFVQAGGAAVDRAAECALYCRRRGYEMTGVVVGTDPAQWAEVIEMVTSRHQAEVVVVPSREVLPDHEIDLESVTQEVPEPDAGDTTAWGRAEPHVSPHRTRQRPRFLRG